MECIYCNSELDDCGSWGYLARHQSGEVLGHTFKCPNSEGFESENEANEYLLKTGDTLESLALTNWQELACESSMHYVCGSFYTDKQGNLHEGYPC